MNCIDMQGVLEDVSHLELQQESLSHIQVVHWGIWVREDDINQIGCLEEEI